MLTRFLPKNERFFDHFRAQAAVALETALAFQDLLEHYTDVERKVRAISALEHKADEVGHIISNALTQTFITPLDREDIVLLSGRMDDFVDAIEDAAKRLWLYRIPAPTEQAIQMGRIIADQAKLLTIAVPLVEKNHDSAELLVRAKEIKQLESQADRIMDQASSSLYDNASDIKTLVSAIRWGELNQFLEDATDRAQDVANALESIALKNA
jgi:predicted phosphate transport protein (TIGR00153 family)